MPDAGSGATALVCATVGFGVTSALALAGADWPPPPGFLGMEALLAVLSAIVYVRVRSRLADRSQRRRVRSAALEGAIASVLAGFTLLVFRLGDPDITLNPLDHVTWIAVVGVAGAAAAQALWAMAVLIDRRITATPPRQD